MIAKLYKDTSLENWYAINMILLDNGRFPKVFGWREACDAYITHIRECKRNMIQFDLDKALARLNVVEGLIMAAASIDEVVALIRSSQNPAEASTKLIARFKFNEEQTKNSDINLKPRLRMSTLYYLAALYSALRGKTYLVAGTSNKCELFVGYFTKGGDNVHDISVIADFTVDEVIKIGEYLKVPERVLYKKPNDGLSNMSDEDKLGVKYSEIADFMNDENSVEKKVGQKIKRLHKNNEHKFNIPTYRR